MNTLRLLLFIVLLLTLPAGIAAPIDQNLPQELDVFYGHLSAGETTHHEFLVDPMAKLVVSVTGGNSSG
ncbi:MAG: hypothetical protein FD161_4924, partial [Limisphaerales bacterium]